MLAQLLELFPPQAYSVLLAHDPDGILDSGELTQAILARGYRLVREMDPVALRLRVEQLRPWSPIRPLLVVTSAPLNTLPYDLWAQGHPVELDVGKLFPELSPSILHGLPADVLARLDLHRPKERLGLNATADLVLHVAYGLPEQQSLIIVEAARWFDYYHQQALPLTPRLRARLLTLLHAAPDLADWPVEQYIDDPALWQRAAPTLIPHVNSTVRDQRGTCYTVDDDLASRLQDLAQRVSSEHLDWPAWREIALHWAKLHNRRLACRMAIDETWEAIEARLDARFAEWLRQNYALLSNPSALRDVPVHLFQTLSCLAFRRENSREQYQALLILDGLSLPDWLRIARIWRIRRPTWHINEAQCLAQIPTITSVSRQSLVSGLPPRQLNISTTAAEPSLWTTFWEQHHVSAAYLRLPESGWQTDDILEQCHGCRALCIIDTSIDNLIHGVTLGDDSVYAAFQVWLDHTAPKLEELIGRLLRQGYIVTIASDHGHVQALGIGTPSHQGVMVETTGRRARLYTNQSAAREAAADIPCAEIWADDSIMADDYCAVLAGNRTAFAPVGITLVTHGGITIDEVIVPHITISGDST